MLTKNTRASRLTLALGALVITGTVSAADVQSQAQEVLIGRLPTPVAVSEATPVISGSTIRAAAPGASFSRAIACASRPGCFHG